MLPNAYFLEYLRREKLRANRTQARLSIVLFVIGNRRCDALADFRKFVAILEDTIRETDILGYLCKNVVGVLLPDTSADGMQELLRKIRPRHSDVDVSVFTATYPDRLFEYLQTEGEDSPNLFPIFLDDFEPLTWIESALKRSIDVVGSVAAILLFSPLMLITAMAIKLTSPGPVIFRQIRCGKRCHPFVFYKFRSMHSNADDRVHRDYVAQLIQGRCGQFNQGDGADPLYKIVSDPRVTRLGRIIRMTSIDELPQLFNVLRGEMSLVGPRPPLPYETDKYQGWHLRRLLDVKPGITGLWQVEGRSTTSFEDMVRLDLQYVRNCSLTLDLKILMKTVKVVLRCKGAV